MKTTRTQNLRIAIQKSGRLSKKSKDIFEKCGIEVINRPNQLIQPALGFPIEFMLVRDDDIPGYVRDGVCDLGVVGRNIVVEKLATDQFTELRDFNFGSCRLALAAAADGPIKNPKDLEGKKIATSYPASLAKYLKSQSIKAEITEMAGSVEIAPAMGIADGICDLVSSGATLLANGLVELGTVLESQAVLIGGTASMPDFKQNILDKLLQRVDGVIKAQQSKYIMMNASTDIIDEIKRILPGMEEPTIVPLTTPGKVAIHTVARENIFWETVERLKTIGASSILVTPIEKAMD
jgi:ATP phosphoribosyltransferase